MTTELSQIKKRFGTFEALKTISLSIEKGEFIAILGPSGCGKTTLLRLLAGFEEPTAGHIAIDGDHVSSAKKTTPPEKRNIGMVFQSFALWPHLSVQEQVEFPLRHHPHTRKDWKKNYQGRALDVLKLVGLEQLAKRMPNELSGGQRQRVALARALAHQPAILLMDEPLSSLDAELRVDMRKEIQRLHRLTNSSIVYVTHDQEEALAMADRIVIMKDGQIEQVGTPQHIYLYPETPFVARFVGKATMVDGRWEGNRFRPDAAPALSWDGEGISEVFKQADTYPVRPNQWLFSREQTGMEATVVNAMFQGRERHYAVDVGGEVIHAISPATEQYKIGEKVSLKMRQAEKQTKAHTG